MTVLIALPSSALAVTSAEKQAEADTARAQLDQYQSDLNQASDDYYEALDARDAALASMDDAQSQMDAANAQKQELQTHLGERARSMYRSGSTSFIDVIFGAASFDDFISTWDFLNDMNADDADCVAEAKQLETEAQAAHDEYTQQAQIAEDKLAESETIKTQAENTLSEQQALTASLDTEVADLVAQEQAAATGAATTADAVVVTDTSDAGTTDSASDSGSSSGGGGTSGSRGDGDYSSVVAAAESRIGCSYVWGASGPDAFDCSGLVMCCYAKIGISLSHSSGSQGFVGSTYPVSEAQPGDILWMDGHVGIYAGDGVSIEAMGDEYGVCYGNAYRFDHATHP